MGAKRFFVFVAIYGTVFASTFSEDGPACNPDDYTNGDGLVDLPTVPDKFFARIESNLGEQKKSMEAHEYRVDPDGKGGMLDINYYHSKLKNFELNRFILDVARDASDMIDEKFGDASTEVCVHMTASGEEHPKNEFFGYEEAAKEGQGEVYTLSGVFNIAKKHKFKSMECQHDKLRGIPCLGFETCIRLNGRESDTVVKTTIFFSDKTRWTEPDGKGIEVPLRIEIYGTGTFGGGSNTETQINHVYEITNFMESYVHERELRYFTPSPHIYCSNRKQENQHWAPPTMYELDVEIVQFVFDSTGFASETVQVYRQYYDEMHKYDRFDFEGEEDRFGDVLIAYPITVIHDFNTGHAYEINRAKDTCVISKLSEESGFDISIAGGKLSLSNPWQFLKPDADYSYQGKHYHRGILSDVNVFPVEENGMKILISLYTASDSIEDDESLVSQRHGPVHVRIKRTSASGEEKEEFPPTEMNILDYQEMQPSLHAWNVGTCFREAGHRKFLEFHLTGKESNWIIEPVRHAIYYEIMSKLAPAAHVAPIRIDNVRISDETRENILVVAFELLEKPPMEGSLTPDFPDEPLADAYRNLKGSYADIEFTISYLLPTTGMQIHAATMKAVPRSLRDIEKALEDGANGGGAGAGGFSGGSLAGLGIGMLVVGGALAFGVIKFMEYRRGNLAGLPSFGAK